MPLKFTFIAQKDKGADLTQKMKDIWEGFLETMGEHGDALKEHVEIEDGETDETVIVVTPPDNEVEHDAEESLPGSINKHTQFEASIDFGRTIDEMWKLKGNTSIPLLPNGIKASAHV